MLLSYKIWTVELLITANNRRISKLKAEIMRLSDQQVLKLGGPEMRSKEGNER